jgi:hypothetical protein
MIWSMLVCKQVNPSAEYYSMLRQDCIVLLMTLLLKVARHIVSVICQGIGYYSYLVEVAKW